jgi:hypothetical protein
MAQAARDVALALGGLQARAAIHQVEATRTLHDHLEQLLRRGQIVLRPAARIIAVHDRACPACACIAAHRQRLTLALFRLGRLGLAMRLHRSHRQRKAAAAAIILRIEHPLHIMARSHRPFPCGGFSADEAICASGFIPPADFMGARAETPHVRRASWPAPGRSRVARQKPCALHRHPALFHKSRKSATVRW